MRQAADDPAQRHTDHRHHDGDQYIERGHGEMPVTRQRHHFIDCGGERGETTKEAGDEQQVRRLGHHLVGE